MLYPYETHLPVKVSKFSFLFYMLEFSPSQPGKQDVRGKDPSRLIFDNLYCCCDNNKENLHKLFSASSKHNQPPDMTLMYDG